MTTRALRSSLKAIAKRMMVLLVSAALFLGLTQTAALAQSVAAASNPALLALAASSRFAAEANSTAPAEDISDAKLDKLREQRREWQSEASSASESAEPGANSVGEAVKDKLNLNEITEENEIVEEASKALKGNASNR